MIVVVAVAALGGRAAGAVAAITAAFSFDFFHTRPYLSLSIVSEGRHRDRGAAARRRADRRNAGRAQRSGRASRPPPAGARSGASTGWPSSLPRGENPIDVISACQAELTALLDLRACRFEAPPYDLSLPRLERSGGISGASTRRYVEGGFDLPSEGVELPVLSRGQPVGRFVLDPTPEVGVSLEQQVVAVALADQVGAALAAAPQQTTPERIPVLDLIFIALIVAFFAVGAAYVRGCARIIGGRPDRNGRPTRITRGTCASAVVTADNVIGLVLAVLLTGYLVVALLFPEKLMTGASWLQLGRARGRPGRDRSAAGRRTWPRCSAGGTRSRRPRVPARRAARLPPHRRRPGPRAAVADLRRVGAGLQPGLGARPLPAAAGPGRPAVNPTERRRRAPRRWRSTPRSASSPTRTGRTTRGENTVSHLTQMVGLAVQNFVSAAVGLAVAVALIRGLTRRRVGDDRQLLGRPHPGRHPDPAAHRLRGRPRAREPGRDPEPRGFTRSTTVEGATQVIPGGPFASQEAIKELGTNGGGPLNANSAHPFENPNGFTNLLQLFLILLIPFALTYTFGRLAEGPAPGLGGVRRHVRPVAGQRRSSPWPSRPAATPQLDRARAPTRRWRADRGQSGGNMEGKEVRFGAAALRAVRRHHHGHVDRRGQLAPTTASRPAAAPSPWSTSCWARSAPAGWAPGSTGCWSSPSWPSSSPGSWSGGRRSTWARRSRRAEMKLRRALHPGRARGRARLQRRLGGDRTRAKASILNAGPHGLTRGHLRLHARRATTTARPSAASPATPTGTTPTLGLAMLAGRFLLIVPAAGHRRVAGPQAAGAAVGRHLPDRDAAVRRPPDRRGPDRRRPDLLPRPGARPDRRAARDLIRRAPTHGAETARRLARPRRSCRPAGRSTASASSTPGAWPATP